MIWNCPRCQNELGELNGWCEYCRYAEDILVYNPDKYYIRDIRIYHLIASGVSKMKDYKDMTEEEVINSIESNQNMTPQEKLFAQLFYHETKLVKDMDLLTLRAHREELSKIAFEARARLSAADAHEEKIKRDSNSKPKGFERSLNVDDTTMGAINKIKERQVRLTKAEKIQAGLEKLGISSTDAAKLMSAGNILGQLKDKKSKDIMMGKETHSPFSQSDRFVILKSAEELKQTENKTSEAKPIFNPFAKQ
jgi:hypothetical protein